MKSLTGKVCLKAIIVAITCFISLSVRAGEKTLKIMAVHFPPYEFETPVDGLKGFDVEVVEEVFRRIGVNTQIVFSPWARALETVITGQENALLSCGYNKERDERLYLSDPISVGTHGYFVREDYSGPLFNSVEEFRGHNITAVLGYSSQKELEERGINHTTARTDKIALNILMAQRVDVFFGTLEANIFIAKQNDLSHKLKHYPLYSKNYHLCFSKKWDRAREILSQFNHSLAQVRADGTYDAIHDKYR